MKSLLGLSNELLEHQASFTIKTVDLINGFLSQHQSPICLVAHNGNNFDYPILKAEINKTKAVLSDVVCVDSLITFQQLHIKNNLNAPERDTIDSSTIPSQLQSQTPFEFTNDYDKILIEASQDVEEDFCDKMTEKQRTNETTPLKQSINSSHHAPNRKKIKLTSVNRRYTFG